MPTCVVNEGFLLSCNEGVGGVKEVFITQWTNLQNGATIDEDGIITAFPNAFTVYRFQPNRNTGSLTVTPTPNLENGTLYYSQVVEFTLGKLDNDKRAMVENLSKAKVAVFVRLYDDQIVLVGYSDGAFLTAGTFQSGKAKGDLNGYQFTLTAEEPNQPYFLDQFVFPEVPFDNFLNVNVSPPYTAS